MILWIKGDEPSRMGNGERTQKKKGLEIRLMKWRSREGAREGVMQESEIKGSTTH